MGSYYIKQPNGKLAIYSTVVDTFTHFDLSEAEALEVNVRLFGREQNAEALAAGLRDDLIDSPGGQGDGLDRWHWALDAIEGHHGRIRRKRIEATILGVARKKKRDRTMIRG